jgi:hypothetical protein
LRARPALGTGVTKHCGKNLLTEAGKTWYTTGVVTSPDQTAGTPPITGKPLLVAAYYTCAEDIRLPGDVASRAQRDALAI